MEQKNTAIEHYFEAFEPRYELPGLSVLVFKSMLTVKLWVDISRSHRQLASIDDALLRDIGITRADATFEANRKFYDI